MSLQEISKSINKYYWFDKESRAGNLDHISGQVVHPPMEDDVDNEEESFKTLSLSLHSRNLDDTKELRIDGCNYEISERELKNGFSCMERLSLTLRKLPYLVSKRMNQLERAPTQLK